MPAHAILFENADFQGNHKHVFDHIHNLSNQVDEFNFNDKISSLVVLEGNWQFFKDHSGRSHGRKLWGLVCTLQSPKRSEQMTPTTR